MTFHCPQILRYVGTRMCCVHCGSIYVQAAHRNQGKGMGLKCSDGLVAALCIPEHTRIDQGKDLLRAERRALIDGYIAETYRRARAAADLPVAILDQWEAEHVKVGLLEVTA